MPDRVLVVEDTHHDRDLAAADNIQRFLEFFTGAESVPGNRPLHPELVAFISRGGMTAFQRGNSRERRQGQSQGSPLAVLHHLEQAQRTGTVKLLNGHAQPPGYWVSV